VLAAFPQSGLADPIRAVSLAQQACKLTGNKSAAYLDTLAVAYAAAGRFDDAIAAAQKAIALARAAGQAGLVKAIEARLELYRSGRAYSQHTGV
jgi:tetratricopeptide (TPR) repeat protein